MADYRTGKGNNNFKKNKEDKTLLVGVGKHANEALLHFADGTSYQYALVGEQLDHYIGKYESSVAAWTLERGKDVSLKDDIESMLEGISAVIIFIYYENQSALNVAMQIAWNCKHLDMYYKIVLIINRKQLTSFSVQMLCGVNISLRWLWDEEAYGIDCTKREFLEAVAEMKKYEAVYWYMRQVNWRCFDLYPFWDGAYKMLRHIREMPHTADELCDLMNLPSGDVLFVLKEMCNLCLICEKGGTYYPAKSVEWAEHFAKLN